MRAKTQEFPTKSQSLVDGFPSEAPMVTEDNKKPGRIWEESLSGRMNIRVLRELLKAEQLPTEVFRMDKHCAEQN